MPKHNFVNDQRVFVAIKNGRSIRYYCAFESNICLAGVPLLGDDPFKLDLYLVKKKLFHDPYLEYVPEKAGEAMRQQILKMLHEDDAAHIANLKKAIEGGYGEPKDEKPSTSEDEERKRQLRNIALDNVASTPEEPVNEDDIFNF